jgi:hypothetical protein
LYLSTKSSEIDLTQYCGRPARPIRSAQDFWPLYVGMARNDYINDSALEFDPGRTPEEGSPLTLRELSKEKLWESDKRAVVMVPRALCLAEKLNNSSAPISNSEPVDLKKLLEEEAEKKAAARQRKEDREKEAAEAATLPEPKSAAPKNDEVDSIRLVIDPENAPTWIKSLLTGNQGSDQDWAVMDSSNPIVKEMQSHVGDNPPLDQVRSGRKRRKAQIERSEEPSNRDIFDLLTKVLKGKERKRQNNSDGDEESDKDGDPGPSKRR